MSDSDKTSKKSDRFLRSRVIVHLTESKSDSEIDSFSSKSKNSKIKLENIKPKKIVKTLEKPNNSELSVDPIKMSSLDVSTALKIIPEFDGSPSNLHRFIACCEIIYSTLNATDYQNFLNLLKSKLIDSAYEVVKYDTFLSWETLKQELKSRFAIQRSVETIQLELITSKQTKEQDIRSFGKHIENLLNELNEACSQIPGTSLSKDVRLLNGRTALKAFQQGLRDPIRIFVKARGYENLKSAIEGACEEELLTDKSTFPKFDTNSTDSKQKIKCQLCNKLGHKANSCFSLQQNSSFNNRPGSYNKFSPSSASSFNNTKYRSVMMCKYCHNYGHEISNCRKRQWAEQNRRPKSLTTDSTNSKEGNLPESVPLNTPQQVRDLKKSVQ